MLVKRVIIKEFKLPWWKRILGKFFKIKDTRKFKYYTPINKYCYLVILNQEYFEYSDESRVFFGLYDKIGKKIYSVDSFIPRIKNVRYILSTAKIIIRKK